MYRNFWFGHFSNEVKQLQTEKKFVWNSWETTWNSLNKKMNRFMTCFPRKDDVVFIGRCCQIMPFERQRLKCVMQEWRHMAKVANEQVIRQLVNACLGKITLVHLHHQRTPQRLFKHRLGWVILVRCDIANQVIATGKEGWRKVLRKKSAAISERSIAKILRHWFKLATWGHYFAYLSLIGMGVV